MTTLVIGERGEGKTTLSLYLAEKASEHVVVFEPKPDSTIEKFAPHAIYVYDDCELESALQSLKESENGVVIFVPSKDVWAGFTMFHDVLHSSDSRVGYSYGGISVVVDEAWSLMSATSSHEDLERLLRLAPREGEYKIDVFVLAHRPKDINRRTHFFSDKICLFRTVSVGDVEAITEYWNEELAEEVSSFKRYSHFFAEYDKNVGKVVVQEDPTKWKPRSK